MAGLSRKAEKAIRETIEDSFRRLSREILGGTSNSLSSNIIALFYKALNTAHPTAIDRRMLDSLLVVAASYLDALKDKTMSNIVSDINEHLKNGYNENQISGIINSGLSKAGNHLNVIAASESNRAINVATGLNISKLADDKGIEDPTVFFIVTVDDVTGDEEFVLHLLPDRKTPRVWRLSEIKFDYHSRGEPYPSMSGLHPNCRCKIRMLMPRYGFNSNGKLDYIGAGYDEFKSQREKYGLPR